jgi:hypothetical protein
MEAIGSYANLCQDLTYSLHIAESSPFMRYALKPKIWIPGKRNTAQYKSTPRTVFKNNTDSENKMHVLTKPSTCAVIFCVFLPTLVFVLILYLYPSTAHEKSELWCPEKYLLANAAFGRKKWPNFDFYTMNDVLGECTTYGPNVRLMLFIGRSRLDPCYP